ncbi:hypothetical protein GCM10025760_19950 [Microbacterium yannicii]|uniref:Uncharacterized protein n=1 Tax=Microbacterium yannicii TaxID=671622 RepID=A0ABP9MAG7_9MICO
MDKHQPGRRAFCYWGATIGRNSSPNFPPGMSRQAIAPIVGVDNKKRRVENPHLLTGRHNHAARPAGQVRATARGETRAAEADCCSSGARAAAV